MRSPTLKSRGAVIGVVVLILSLGIVSAHANNLFTAKAHERVNSLTVDVAENPFRFSFDTAGPLLEDGTPAYGNPFVTQGYLYPKGTLQHGDSGVDTDGNPLYPDLVLGEWTCRGVFIGEGFATVTGPIVNTTQLFSFYHTPGYDPGKLAGAVSLVTEGFELADVGVPVERAITGGTGRFQRAGSEAEQELLGISQQMAVTLRVRFRIR